MSPNESARRADCHQLTAQSQTENRQVHQRGRLSCYGRVTRNVNVCHRVARKAAASLAALFLFACLIWGICSFVTWAATAVPFALVAVVALALILVIEEGTR